MKTRGPSWRRLGLLAAVLVLASVGVSRLAGASDPDSSASAPAPAPTTATAGPSATASMVCGAEIRGDVRTVLALPTAPPVSSTWRDGVFTCTYRLPMGPLVLSVHESPDPASARAWYAGEKESRRAAKDTPGLGEKAFRTPEGLVVVIKDADVLTVDATGLPVQFGDQGQKRTDLAYEIASDVLGCWTGHEVYPDGRSG